MDHHVERQLAVGEAAHRVVADLELPGHDEADPLVGHPGALETVEAVEHQADEVVGQRFTAHDPRVEVGCPRAHPDEAIAGSPVGAHREPGPTVVVVAGREHLVQLHLVALETDA